MSTVLVTGGSGTFGSKLVPLLQAQGHDVRVLSRQPGRGTHQGDLSTGEGLVAAGAGAELVLHAASDTHRLGRADVAQTRNLLSAIPDCRHLLYISIVGIDQIPYRYYKAKLDCERVIADGGIGHTILRATQFHELLALLLSAIARAPVALLPLDLPFQCVAAAEVAARAADLLTGEPAGRADDFGGPQVLNGWQLAAIWRRYHPVPQLLLRARWPGSTYRAFVAGLHTTPGHADGKQTWAEFARSGA